MIRYLIKRFLVAIPTFLGITLIVFILSNMAPGSRWMYWRPIIPSLRRRMSN